MRSLLLPVLLLLSLAVSPAQAAVALSDEEDFSIPSATPGVNITGIIDLPGAALQADAPVVVLVGGTYSSADGAPYIIPDLQARKGRFFYRDIGRNLAARGYRVVRFDHRGLGSVLACERRAGRPLGPYQYLARKQCFDVDAAGTTTVETRIDDLAAVLRMVEQRWPAQGLVLLAHSEGVMPVSALVGQRRASPLALIFLSTFAGSSKDLIHWQFVDRQVGWVADLLKQGRAQVSNADIAALDADKRFFFRTELMKSPTGTWTAATLPRLRAALQAHYEDQLRRLLARGPGTKHHATLGDGMLPNVPVASAAYMNSLLVDEVSVLDRLADFPGRVVFVYGDNDILVNVDTQLALIARARLKRNIEVVRLVDTNHWLGRADGDVQPSALEAIARLVDDARRAGR